MISTVAIDSPVWASHYNQLVNAVNGGAINFYENATALSAVDTTDTISLSPLAMTPRGLYKLLSLSLTADGEYIIQPSTGPGVWVLNFDSLQVFNQSAHGFDAGKVIRWNGSSFVLAQGNSELGATNAWLVTAIFDNDNFWAIKSGRRNVTGHGLGSAGQTLYLSETTAGALTATRPDADYYLPVCTVVDANTLDIAIELLPRYERRELVIASGSGTIPNTGSPDYVTIDTPIDLTQKANHKLRLRGRSDGGYFAFTNVSYTSRSGRKIGKEYSTGTSNPSISSIGTNSGTYLRIQVAGIDSRMFPMDCIFDFEIIYDPSTATIRVYENTQGSAGEVKAFAKFSGVSFTDTPVLYRLYGDNFEPYEFVLERD